MGNSLHNKIHLGRAPFLSSKRGQATLCIATAVGIGLVWFIVHNLR